MLLASRPSRPPNRNNFSLVYKSYLQLGLDWLDRGGFFFRKRQSIDGGQTENFFWIFDFEIWQNINRTNFNGGGETRSTMIYYWIANQNEKSCFIFVWLINFDQIDPHASEIPLILQMRSDWIRRVNKMGFVYSRLSRFLQKIPTLRYS